MSAADVTSEQWRADLPVPPVTTMSCHCHRHSHTAANDHKSIGMMTETICFAQLYDGKTILFYLLVSAYIGTQICSFLANERQQSSTRDSEMAKMTAIFLPQAVKFWSASFCKNAINSSFYIDETAKKSMLNFRVKWCTQLNCRMSFTTLDIFQ